MGMIRVFRKINNKLLEKMDFPSEVGEVIIEAGRYLPEASIYVEYVDDPQFYKIEVKNSGSIPNVFSSNFLEFLFSAGLTIYWWKKDKMWSLDGRFYTFKVHPEDKNLFFLLRTALLDMCQAVRENLNSGEKIVKEFSTIPEGNIEKHLEARLENIEKEIKNLREIVGIVRAYCANLGD